MRHFSFGYWLLASCNWLGFPFIKLIISETVTKPDASRQSHYLSITYSKYSEKKNKNIALKSFNGIN